MCVKRCCILEREDANPFHSSHQRSAFPLKLDRAKTDFDEQGPKFKQQALTEEVNTTLHSGGSKSPVVDLNSTRKLQQL